MKTLALLTLIVLGGCTSSVALLGVTKEKVQSGTDIFAQTTLATDCAITFGAYTRLPLNQRLALELNCGGNWLDTLKSLGVLNGIETLNENTITKP